LNKVLVIDDSETARHAMKRVLEVGGYRVLTLPSGIGASRLIQRETVNAVVVDVSMPGLPGDKLVEMLRKNARTRELVILVVSGCEIDELEEIRARCGADDAVAKRELATTLLPALARNLCRASAARLAGQTKAERS
jgi:two-component system NtrC family sensor kinase